MTKFTIEGEFDTTKETKHVLDQCVSLGILEEISIGEIEDERRVEKGELFYYITEIGEVDSFLDTRDIGSTTLFYSGNYYKTEKLAYETLRKIKYFLNPKYPVRMEKGETYYVIDCDGMVFDFQDEYSLTDKELFSQGNYFPNRVLAKSAYKYRNDTEKFWSENEFRLNVCGELRLK